ncbi:MAG: peptidase, partial [Firmicutes bacterium]|nr:peptidase [Bacillota bacterium]
MNELLSWEKIEASIPDYQVFLTVDELNERTRKLSSQHPDIIEESIIGQSRSGEPIY